LLLTGPYLLAHLNRQIGRLLALEEAIDVAGRIVGVSPQSRTVAHRGTRDGKITH
jgi:hypothetical protein